ISSAAAPIEKAAPRAPMAATRRKRSRATSWRRVMRASRERAARHRIHEEIHTHAQRGLVQRRRIMIDLGVLPAVSEIARIDVVHHQPVTDENAEALCRLAVVHV